MKIYDLLNKEGRVFAFEINNFPFFSQHRTAVFLASIPGVEVIRWPIRRFFSFEEDFCEFTVAGKHFVAVEPFGDNSRYWVGPEEPGAREWSKELEMVREVFANYHPWWPF